MKIAYLAPEIPALSATFVYKEIQALESMGLDILPFSIHEPFNEASDPSLSNIKEKTIFVYKTSWFFLLAKHAAFLVKRPLSYARSFSMLLRDVMKLGLFTRKALGQVFRFYYAAKVATDIEQNGCEHLHVHFAHVPTDVAMYAASLAHITYSVTAHANDLFERAWLLDEKVSRAKFFATISEFNRQFLAKQGIDTKNVEIVRCGVDETQFSPSQHDKTSSIFKIGVVGRLVEKKGIDTLIKAVSHLTQKGVQLEVVIAGSGPLEMELKSLAAGLELPENSVRFIGALPHTDVVDFIKSLNAFVLPCKQDQNGDMDGIPVVLMEAMLSGIPVIAGKISGIPELVVDRETGLLVEPGDDVALSQAIVELMENSQLEEKIVGNAIEKVRTEFSIVPNSKRLIQLFK